MNDHTLRVLEYDKVREIVSRFAFSGPGRLAAAGLLPAVKPEEVARLQEETREFLRLMSGGDSPPLDGIRDLAPQLEKLRVSGIALTPSELLNITSTLAAGRRVRRFFQQREEKETPRLSATAGRITPLKDIEEAVLAVVDDKGEVRDSASPALRRIRKQLGRTREEILDRLSRILKAGADGNIVQDQVITLRDDRYVIPLKPNFRQSVKGVVHGQSGSRATLFVEPLDVLEQNNRLAELRMEEREEIERLLRELTRLCAERADEIEETLTALAALDAVQARARFGAEFNGTVPPVSPDGRIRLRAARHPLLVRKAETSGGEATPNDLDLGGDERALIISGPNAGGKTVMLKTVGLLCLLSQAGIPATAAEGSELPVFGAVYADIGDEQSLEQDLSTFSSHVRQIAGILRSAKQDSLVLLDELGAGTDPAEGSALGAAVLAKLLDLGCTTVVTTHHGMLKLFGAKTSGAANGAMEFDPATLRPTYRFRPGRPGRSYGLDMAARLGIAADVVSDAAGRLGANEAGIDRLLERLESDSRALGIAREEAEKELAAAGGRKKEAEALLRAAREEALTIKTNAKEEAREVLHALRRKLTELSRAALRPAPEIAGERAAVEALASRLEPEASAPESFARPGHEFHAGERVRMPRLKKTGTVLVAKKGVLEIDAGGVTLKIASDEAVPLETAEPARRPASSGWGADLGESSGMPDRLNLLGFRVDDALAEVERLLGRAAIENRSMVTIIHGLGTGALKTAVTEFLKQHPLVESFRAGEPSEGGAGVTVAELKK